MTVDLEGEGEYAEAVRQGKAVVGEWNPKVSPPPAFAAPVRRMLI